MLMKTLSMSKKSYRRIRKNKWSTGSGNLFSRGARPKRAEPHPIPKWNTKPKMGREFKIKTNFSKQKAKIKLVQEFKANSGPIWCSRFSKCGEYFATAGRVFCLPLSKKGHISLRLENYNGGPNSSRGDYKHGKSRMPWR